VLFLQFLIDQFGTEIDAFIADIAIRSGNQLADLLLSLIAE
jgi:hypothetical protein